MEPQTGDNGLQENADKLYPLGYKELRPCIHMIITGDVALGARKTKSVARRSALKETFVDS